VEKDHIEGNSLSTSRFCMPDKKMTSTAEKKTGGAPSCSEGGKRVKKGEIGRGQNALIKKMSLLLVEESRGKDGYTLTTFEASRGRQRLALARMNVS